MLVNTTPSATQPKNNKYKGILNFSSKGHIPMYISWVLDAPNDNKINIKKNKKKDFINLILFN